MSVSQVTKHGLLLDFLSSFSGNVDFLHMEPDQRSSYREGGEVQRNGPFSAEVADILMIFGPNHLCRCWPVCCTWSPLPVW